MCTFQDYMFYRASTFEQNLNIWLKWVTNVSHLDWCGPGAVCNQGVTFAPTKVPTNHPTIVLPTVSQYPTVAPTKHPTVSTDPPTVAPTKLLTVPPTNPPTATPSKLPTLAPTNPPTVAPTNLPTVSPPLTVAPTKLPTDSTDPPTVAPMKLPTVPPTHSPTVAPTKLPTVAPTNPPAVAPTNLPTVSQPPTIALTNAPTVTPDDCVNGSEKFFFKLNKRNKLKACLWLANNKNKAKICSKKVDYYDNFGPPQDVCQRTCVSCGACFENSNSKWVFSMKKDWESNPKNMLLACRAEYEKEEELLQEKETCVWWL